MNTTERIARIEQRLTPTTAREFTTRLAAMPHSMRARFLTNVEGRLSTVTTTTSPQIRPSADSTTCLACIHVELNECTPSLGFCGCQLGRPGHFARSVHCCDAFKSSTRKVGSGHE